MKNHQLPSTLDEIIKKLLLLYVGPQIITKIKEPNVYIVFTVDKGTIKSVLNQSEPKLYYE